MNTDNNKITNEINQYITTLEAKGFSREKALGFALAAAYSFLDETQIDEMFALLSEV